MTPLAPHWFISPVRDLKFRVTKMTFILLVCFSNVTFAEALAPIQGQLKATFDPVRAQISGTLTYVGQWPATCDLHPPTWAEAFFDQTPQIAQLLRDGTSMSFFSAKMGEKPRIKILEKKPSAQGLEVTFTTSLAPEGEPPPTSGIIPLIHWYPELRCGNVLPRATFAVHFASPNPWQVALAGTSAGKGGATGTVVRQQTHLVGALHTGTKTANITNGTQSLTVLGTTQKFVEVQEQAQTLLKYYKGLFPQAPASHMLLIETTQPMQFLQYGGLIGLSAEPFAADRLGAGKPETLRLWALAELVASLWWPHGLTLDEEDRQGVIQWMALQALAAKDSTASDALQAPVFLGSMEWTYRDHILLQLATSKRYRLTSGDSWRRSVMASLRLTVALEHASHVLGKENVSKKLHLAHHHLLTQQEPDFDLVEHLKSIEADPENPSQDTIQLEDFLSAWSNPSSYWDPAIKEVTKSASGSSLIIDIEQKGDIKLPVLVQAKWTDGRVVEKLAMYQLVIQIPAKREKGEGPKDLTIELDPRNFALDSNRNNNTLIPALNLTFWPGQAKGLDEQGVTAMLFPLIARQSGSEWSYGLGSRILGYSLHSGTIKAAYSPSEKKVSWDARYSWLTPVNGLDFAGRWNRTVRDDMSLTLGPRLNLVGDTLERFPLQVGAGLFKPFDDSAYANPITFSLGDGLFNVRDDLWVEFGLHYTLAPQTSQISYSFTRATAAAKGTFQPISSILCEIRGFWGQVHGQGEVPVGAFLDPQDPEGADVRVDILNANDLRARSITGLNSEISLFGRPAIKGVFPGLGPRQRLRSSIFHDFARTLLRNQKEQILQSVGIGFRLPLVTPFHQGPAAFPELALDGVLRSRVDQKIDPRTKILLGLNTQF